MSKMSSWSAVSSFLAQTAAPGAPSSTQAGLVQFLPLILLGGGFYFLLVAPQRKKQKQHDKMLAALQSGDEVITTGGIYGVITNVKDDRFVVRIADNTKIELGKSFVTGVIKTTVSDTK